MKIPPKKSPATVNGEAHELEHRIRLLDDWLRAEAEISQNKARTIHLITHRIETCPTLGVFFQASRGVLPSAHSWAESHLHPC
jgi:hypothetical protein